MEGPSELQQRHHPNGPVRGKKMSTFFRLAGERKCIYLLNGETLSKSTRQDAVQRAIDLVLAYFLLDSVDSACFKATIRKTPALGILCLELKNKFYYIKRS